MGKYYGCIQSTLGGHDHTVHDASSLFRSMNTIQDGNQGNNKEIKNVWGRREMISNQWGCKAPSRGS
eukprot:scaffold96532_cov22-Tisochrysis_lutea.AAC.1